MSAPRQASGVVALLVGVASCVVVTWWMLREVKPAPIVREAHLFLVPVTTVAVTTGDVAELVELVGDVRAPERAQLAFERSGRIHELPIRAGDVVVTGAVLARLDDSVMEEEVRASEAALQQSREMSELATRDADRLKKIEDVGATAAEIDRAEAAARNEAAKVAQMEADVALQRARLRQGILVAPFDAEVTTRPVALGSYVDAGDPCCELLSLERREIVLEIPPSVGATVRPGAAVKLRSDALPGFELAATLHSVLPSPELRGRTFSGLIRLEKGDDAGRLLRPGMFVRAVVEVRGARQALTVPIDCLLETESGFALVNVVPGTPPTAGQVPVTVLARNEKVAAVAPLGAATLAAGDEVVLVGKENATAGKPIVRAGS